MLIKDNYEGGATWAYEVGSQSMVCPIIVEDLNQPRQMLVEVIIRNLFSYNYSSPGNYRIIHFIYTGHIPADAL